MSKSSSNKKIAPIPPTVSAPNSDPLADVIGTTEAAELLGATQEHVEFLCRNKRIQCKVIGKGTWVILKPSVLYYKDHRSKGGRPSKQNK